MVGYNPSEIEPRWQRHWDEHDCFRAGARPDLPKFYVLDMFPYPSGSGLHVGHTEGYTASDIVSRYKRMKGFDVLHPMGWDAFGLPAEQFAIDQGVHPETSTRANIETFRSQLQRVGFSYDWEREFGTIDPGYYQWTQWIFTQLLERGLAYRSEATVNWCPALGTVLANDEVIDGKSERGGHEVVQRPMKQWMLRITDYADRLLDGLDDVDFPESIKAMQRDRIGRSEGADAFFDIVGHDARMEIFTTRPDTMFGATFCVLAPEHPLVDKITTDAQRDAVESYVSAASRKSDLERTGTNDKTGVFTGALARNPMSGRDVPIWVGDYVLMTYGTGAIMCVPGHDQRDWEFAREFGLDIVEVITGGNLEESAHEGDGSLVNSGFLDGMPKDKAIDAASQWLEDNEIGRRVVRYRMRDWIFARQRYWGEPVPVVFDDEGVAHGVPQSALPVELPKCEDFQPTGTGQSPLSRVENWVKTDLPNGGTGTREVDTMPGSAGSSWYFLRFIDPKNNDAIADPDLLKRWMPVDLYMGGAEHAVGHLIYSRFWTKFLYDIGVCPVEEPYKKLVNQGMILGEDHRKMSKRFGNTIDPVDVVEAHGADTLRMYEMFMGPLTDDKPWSTGGVDGVKRFLNKVWRLFVAEDGNLHSEIRDVEPPVEVSKLLHRTIEKVDSDTDGLHFNTAISQMMIFINEMQRQEARPRSVLRDFVKILQPYAPHIAEELWHRLGESELLMWAPYPEVRPEFLVDDVVEIPVQVNGKVRDKIELSAEADDAAARETALSSERIQEWVAGKDITKFMYVPKRMIVIVAK